MNRWAVLFRYLLAIPAGIAAGLVSIGMSIFWIVAWVATLIKGEMPQSMYEANAATIRFRNRYIGYYSMLTSFYPAQVMGDGATPSGTPNAPQAGVEVPSAPQQAGPPTAPPPLQGASIRAGFGADPTTLASPSDVDPSVAAWTHWHLLLASGARKLVVTFFILVGLSYVLYAAIIIPTSISVTSTHQQSISAQNQAVDAFNALDLATRTFASTAKGCQQSATAAAEVQCLEANDAHLLTGYQAYAAALATIPFFCVVRSGERPCRGRQGRTDLVQSVHGRKRSTGLLGHGDQRQHPGGIRQHRGNVQPVECRAHQVGDVSVLAFPGRRFDSRSSGGGIAFA